jgi:hypothetical protein
MLFRAAAQCRVPAALGFHPLVVTRLRQDDLGRAEHLAGLGRRASGTPAEHDEQGQQQRSDPHGDDSIYRFP